ncbi:peptidoglycan/LPS O-acetylase OafA/YrhL [Streptomyces sp. SAI-170]|uniref:HGxxPAAW family protein n=1 Tax=unclassified Streptomyces TaxID=2593676 RepID=UPI003822AA6F
MADSSHGHGHTPAAWTGVIIAFIGFCAAGAFMVMANPLGFWGGMAVVVLGGVVGLVMRAMGMGAPKAEPLVMTKAPAVTAPVVTREPVPAES